jgi:hypothetical protein
VVDGCVDGVVGAGSVVIGGAAVEGCEVVGSVVVAGGVAVSLALSSVPGISNATATRITMPIAMAM